MHKRKNLNTSLDSTVKRQVLHVLQDTSAFPIWADVPGVSQTQRNIKIVEFFNWMKCEVPATTDFQ